MQSKAQIDEILRQKSDAAEIPGVVAMAATSKEIELSSVFPSAVKLESWLPVVLYQLSIVS